jgi:hypothetical protein
VRTGYAPIDVNSLFFLGIGDVISGTVWGIVNIGGKGLGYNLVLIL